MTEMTPEYMLEMIQYGKCCNTCKYSSGLPLTDVFETGETTQCTLKPAFVDPDDDDKGDIGEGQWLCVMFDYAAWDPKE